MVVATRGYDRRARKLFTAGERASAELEIALAPTAWPGSASRFPLRSYRESPLAIWSGAMC
jgi:hypothetical protein